MCIILVANIISLYVRPFLWISTLSTLVTDVSSQFSTSQLCDMIVFAAHFMGTLFDHQIVLSMHKKSGKGELAGR